MTGQCAVKGCKNGAVGWVGKWSILRHQAFLRVIGEAGGGFHGIAACEVHLAEHHDWWTSLRKQVKASGYRPGMPLLEVYAWVSAEQPSFYVQDSFMNKRPVYNLSMTLHEVRVVDVFCFDDGIPID